MASQPLATSMRKAENPRSAMKSMSSAGAARDRFELIAPNSRTTTIAGLSDSIRVMPRRTANSTPWAEILTRSTLVPVETRVSSAPMATVIESLSGPGVGERWPESGHKCSVRHRSHPPQSAAFRRWRAARWPRWSRVAHGTSAALAQEREACRRISVVRAIDTVCQPTFAPTSMTIPASMEKRRKMAEMTGSYASEPVKAMIKLKSQHGTT